MNSTPVLKSSSNAPASRRTGESPLRLWAVAAALALLAPAAGCKGKGGAEGPPAPPPSPVEVVIAGPEPVEDRLTAIGTVYANESVEVRPEVAGQIKAIHFQEGQKVKAGTLLFELNGEKELAQLEQAKVDLELARQNAERAETLSGTKAISKQEIDQIKSIVAVRDAALKYQNERVRETRIVAPFDGVLGPRNFSPGQYVNIGDSLVTLTDDQRVKITYSVPERHLAELKLDQEVKIQVAAYPGKVFTGKVDLVNPQVDLATRNIEIRALVPNPEGLLRPGMFANVETITGKRPDALVIPEKALVPSLSGFSVYVVSSNQARITPVTLGARLPGKAEVTEGISAGQQVIVSGLQKIMDGAPVQPSPAGASSNQPPAAASAKN